MATFSHLNPKHIGVAVLVGEAVAKHFGERNNVRILK